jgi:hypothetical protein
MANRGAPLPAERLDRQPRRVGQSARWIADHCTVLVLTFSLTPKIDLVTDLLGHLNLDDRRDAYTDLLTITTLFAGFSTLATATYLGWSSRGVTAVRALVGADLMKLWLSATCLPWVCSVAIFVSSLVDRGDPTPTNPARWVAVGALIVLAQQLVRVLFLFYSLAIIEQKPKNPVRPVADEPIGMRRAQ